MTIYNLVSLAGLFGLMATAWAVSRNRRNVNWRLIVWATVLQLAFGLFVFQSPVGRDALWAAGQTIVRLIALGNEGVEFVFGNLAISPPDRRSLGFFLIFQGFPVIIFFSAFMALLYYLRILPAVVRAFAWVFARTMRVSGAEALYTAGQIFTGVESATAIRPYLLKMTDSELHALMTAGLSTVATNILALYVAYLTGVVEDAAGHLMAASVLGAPAALVAAKLVWPEDGRPETMGHVPPVHTAGHSSATDAVINGAMDGVRLIVGIVALLIAFLGLLAVANSLLGWLANVQLETLLGYAFRPFALMMGVPWDDADKVAELLGTRTIATEVVSYNRLAAWTRDGLIGPRAALISVYALCGFAHVASVAIYIGGTAALVPERRKDLAKVAWRALLAGTIASMMTGAVAGVCYTG